MGNPESDGEDSDSTSKLVDSAHLPYGDPQLSSPLSIYVSATGVPLKCYGGRSCLIDTRISSRAPIVVLHVAKKRLVVGETEHELLNQKGLV